MTAQGKTGQGRFQWNRGGWFGGQVGSTLWLLLLGGMLLAQGRAVGALVLAFGLAANAAGVALWRRRETMDPYPAIQMMIGGCGIAALASVLAISFFAPTPEARELTPSLATLLIYPALMLLFHLQERSGRNDAG